MIKLNTSLAGDDFAYAVGEEVTLDKAYEQRLVDSGQAVYVKPSEKSKKTKKSK